MSQARWAAYDYRIDDIIEPGRSRPVLASALAMVEGKRRGQLRTRRSFDTA